MNSQLRLRWLFIILITVTIVIATDPPDLDLNSARIDHVKYTPMAEDEASSESFDNMLVLIKPDIYIIFWSHNATDIRFEVHVKTPGMLTFGLSPDGSMSYSDVILAWVNDDGLGHFSERHFDNQLIPVVEKSRNWIPLWAVRSQNTTKLKFSRKLTICKSLPNEVNINVSAVNYIVYSVGDGPIRPNVPLVYREKYRGSKHVSLLRRNFKSKAQCEDKTLEISSFESQLKPTAIYANKNVLVKDMFVLFWNVTSKRFLAELHVNTNGWIGFGFSPDGQLANSDMFVGWIQKKKSFHRDCFVAGNKLLEDVNNNVRVVYAKELNGCTVFRIERNLNLCDSDDLSIEIGSPYVVYAWGAEDPESISEIQMDNATKIGFSQIHVFNTINTDKQLNVNIDKSSEQVDFTMSNTILPSSDEFFYCKAFRIDPMAKSHITKWEIILPETASREHVRHVILYECAGSYTGNPSIDSGDCFSNSYVQSFCSAVMVYWTRGGRTSVDFPSNTGYPIGVGSGYSFVVLEVAYENASGLYVDSLTVRLHLTDSLKPNELGSLTLGADADPTSILVPPSSKSFPITSYCFNECIRSKLISGPITFVMAYPHTKSSGVQVFTRIVRNGTDRGYLHNNRYFNPRVQNFYAINPPITLEKNDSLVTKCVYSTLNRTKMTFGGINSADESCMHLFYYYPRLDNFHKCGSFPTFDDQLAVFSDMKKHGNLKFSDMYDSSSTNSMLAGLYDAYDGLRQAGNFTDHMKAKLFSLYADSSFYSTCQTASVNSVYKPIASSSVLETPAKTCDMSRDESRYVKPLVNANWEPPSGNAKSAHLNGRFSFVHSSFLVIGLFSFIYK